MTWNNTDCDDLVTTTTLDNNVATTWDNDDMGQLRGGTIMSMTSAGRKRAVAASKRANELKRAQTSHFDLFGPDVRVFYIYCFFFFTNY